METGIAAQIRRQHPDRYTTAEAARLVGKSVDTLRRWRRNGEVVPSDSTAVGELTVHLYTPDDIDRMKQFSAQQRPGPKTKEKT